MRHEGYLGAIGAFIKGAEEEAGALSMGICNYNVFLCKTLNYMN